MKTKEYISKYKLNDTNKFNHKEFVQDLTVEFMSALEITKNKNSEFNIKGFENTVKVIRMKWDAINNKTVNGGLPDSLWNYFYATVIVKMRDEMFPKEKKKREEQKERRERRQKEFDEDFGYPAGFGDFSSMFALLFKNALIPHQELEILGLTETSTLDDLKLSYRKLALEHHPDKGGNADDFRRFTEAKNKCEIYLKQNS